MGRGGRRKRKAHRVHVISNRSAVRDVQAAALRHIHGVTHPLITSPVRRIADRLVRAAARNVPHRFAASQPESWAAGALHVAARQVPRPRMTAAAVAVLLHVSTATVNTRSQDLRTIAPGIPRRSPLDRLRDAVDHMTEVGKS